MVDSNAAAQQFVRCWSAVMQRYVIAPTLRRSRCCWRCHPVDTEARSSVSGSAAHQVNVAQLLSLPASAVPCVPGIYFAAHLCPRFTASSSAKLEQKNSHTKAAIRRTSSAGSLHLLFRDNSSTIHTRWTLGQQAGRHDNGTHENYGCYSSCTRKYLADTDK